MIFLYPQFSLSSEPIKCLKLICGDEMFLIKIPDLQICIVTGIIQFCVGFIFNFCLFTCLNYLFKWSVNFKSKQFYFCQYTYFAVGVQ